MNTDIGTAEVLPLLSIILGVIGVILWQIKRWSDAKPFVDFFVTGGETSGGQTFGFKVINRGQVSAYKLALFVTWHDSPVWTHSAFPGGKQDYAEVGLNSKVQACETELLKAWIDYHDQYSRHFQISCRLVRRWNNQHHKFFFGQAPGVLVVRCPNWGRDILRWKKVKP